VVGQRRHRDRRAGHGLDAAVHRLRRLVDDEADTDMLAAAYVALGYVDGKNFRHVIQPGAAHNETYWAERFPGAMQLVLGTR
jgi:hypothetical protein